MKKSSFFLSACLALAVALSASSCSRSSARASAAADLRNTSTLRLSPAESFQALRVSGPVRVVYTPTSRKPSVTADVAPEYQDRVHVDVRDGVLTVRADCGRRGKSSSSEPIAVVRVSGPDLERADLSALACVELTGAMTSRRLALRLSSAAMLTMKDYRGDALDVELGSSSRFETGTLRVGAAKVALTQAAVWRVGGDMDASSFDLSSSTGSRLTVDGRLTSATTRLRLAQASVVEVNDRLDGGVLSLELMQSSRMGGGRLTCRTLSASLAQSSRLSFAETEAGTASICSSSSAHAQLARFSAEQFSGEVSARGRISATSFAADEAEVKASSTGRVQLPGCKVSALRVTASSGSRVELDGKCHGDARLESSSGARIRAGGLACRNVEAEASSGSHISCRASERLRQHYGSGARIECSGRPREVQTVS